MTGFSYDTVWPVALLGDVVFIINYKEDIFGYILDAISEPADFHQ